MTIFQKMLILPLLSLVFYSGFLLYSYSETQKNNVNIIKIRDDFLPLQELANENVRLFNQISEGFKDAVVAGDDEWLNNNDQLQQRVEANLDNIGRFPHIVDPRKFKLLQNSFRQYCEISRKLSLSFLNNPAGQLPEESLIQQVGFFHNRSDQLFSEMKTDINDAFKEMVDRTHQDQQQLTMMSSGIAVTLLVGFAVIGLITSLSIRKKLLQINNRMKDLANGSTDFSRRLESNDNDELGTLTHWFNQLSDKLENVYKNVETISVTDKLTGLNNRFRTDQFLEECLTRASASDTPLSVVMLDIDHFKSINDRYGHLVGDDVLKFVANTLKMGVDPTDFIGRWGGEEFVLLLPNKSLQTAQAQADTIRQNIAEAVIPGVGSITASFGVTQMITEDSADKLLNRADSALYRAKQNGRNRVAAALTD